MLGWSQSVNGFISHTVGICQVYDLDISQYGRWIKDRRGKAGRLFPVGSGDAFFQPAEVVGCQFYPLR